MVVPRFGWEIIDAGQLGLGFRSSGSVRGVVHVGCDLGDRKAWFDSAQGLARRLDASSAATASVDEAIELFDSTRNPLESAIAQHLIGTAMYRAGDYPDAAQAWQTAADAWLRLGDRIRSGAATLGVSDMHRLIGNLGATRSSALRALELLDHPDAGYFRLRARENLCGVLHWERKLDEAVDCLSPLPGEFLALPDIDGALNASVNLLALKRDLGERIDAGLERRRLQTALDSEAVAPMRKGRFELTLAMALRDQGQFADSIRGFERALEHFSASTEDKDRWIANALLQVAGLHTDLGQYADAYQAHRLALEHLEGLRAPGRVAAALTRLADIDRRSGNPTRALYWSRYAIDIYRSLKMPGELALSEIAHLEAALDSDSHLPEIDVARLKADVLPVMKARLDVALARASLGKSPKESLAVLRKIADTDPSLPARTQAATALVADALGRNEPATAVALLKTQFQTTTSAVELSSAPLAYGLISNLRELKDQLPRLLLDPAIDSLTREQLVDQYLSTTPFNHFNEAEAPQSLDFSAAVAKSMVNGGAITDQFWRALASKLSKKRVDRRSGKIVDGPAWSGLQPDELLAVHVMGEPLSALVLVREGQLEIRQIPGRSHTNELVRSLNRVIRDRTATLHDLDSAVASASAALFGEAAEPLPARLVVVADPNLPPIPWSILVWPGSSAPLVESTPISVVTRTAGERINSSTILEVSAIVANPAANQHGLSSLPNANYEAELIAANTSLTLSAFERTSADAAIITDVLLSESKVAHVAAHGYSRPGLLGHSGIWLTDSQGSPFFLSWMDVADRPLHAPLAVLNVCQLADSSAQWVNAPPSFALAVSAAGVRNVVAASWPVSDSATNVWVPVFYRRLGNDADNSAEALRQAQLAMRQSRFFRHPYYWSSFAHYRHLRRPTQRASL